jgi:hypothetical protein
MPGTDQNGKGLTGLRCGRRAGSDRPIMRIVPRGYDEVLGSKAVHTMKITYTVPDGTPGVDGDAYNPLARALSRLLKTGRPFERFLACHFDPLPMAVGIRWFGTFVFSDGGRVIYFPGLSERQRLTLTSKGSGEVRQHDFEVDHFSLESNRREWHVTACGSEQHIGSFRTVDLGEGRVLWFGMSVASPDVLRPVKISTEVEAQLPPTDSRRRADVAVQAREGIVFNTLLFDQECQPAVPGFGHFAVIVGPCGFSQYRGQQLGAPFGSPFIEPPLGNLANVFLRSHRLSLEPRIDVEIVTAILPGRVTVPAALTSPAA